jgi:hypothetical protein
VARVVPDEDALRAPRVDHAAADRVGEPSQPVDRAGPQDAGPGEDAEAAQ